MLIDTITHLLNHYPHLFLFIGPILGEEVLLVLVFLAGGGIVPLWSVMIYGLLGMLFADCLWYLLGRASLTSAFISKQNFFKKGQRELGALEQISSHKLLFIFPLTKFVYGTRSISLFLSGLKKIPFWKLLIADIISIIIWAGIMFPLALFAGHGTISSFASVKRIEHFIGYFLVGIFFLFVIVKYLIPWIVKSLLKKDENLNANLKQTPDAQQSYSQARRGNSRRADHRKKRKSSHQ